MPLLSFYEVQKTHFIIFGRPGPGVDSWHFNWEIDTFGVASMVTEQIEMSSQGTTVVNNLRLNEMGGGKKNTPNLLPRCSGHPLTCVLCIFHPRVN